MNKLFELLVLHLICNKVITKNAAVNCKCCVKGVKAGCYLHSLHFINSVTVCHINTGLLECGTAVRELVLDNEILGTFCINKRCDVGALSCDNRCHILDAKLLKLLFHRLCRSRSDLVDHGPGEGYELLIFKVSDEICRNKTLLLPLFCHCYDGAHELLAVV